MEPTGEEKRSPAGGAPGVAIGIDRDRAPPLGVAAGCDAPKPKISSRSAPETAPETRGEPELLPPPRPKMSSLPATGPPAETPPGGDERAPAVLPEEERIAFMLDPFLPNDPLMDHPSIRLSSPLILHDLCHDRTRAKVRYNP
jgi:hypothetical protein